ncbi:1,2-dihydroxy-3-keto-5-methylthiopentene dioxygenase [Mycena sanguinolenta]|uniref:acireductone dioxygenase (Fe(2+)-requiring) n=1 Tax=Mycena sanguinolenta TaxID=230812 RepID=A0A8H6Y7T1_9AGAR|nr:1,2-dihydroxy-3-keto-5-methylthiopentene dioxygenase [Mycena sanguinolenta]
MHTTSTTSPPTSAERLPHTTDPLRPVSAETLAKLGVLSWIVPVDGHEGGVDEGDEAFEVNRVAKERGYKARDVINVSREGMGSVYEEKIRGCRPRTLFVPLASPPLLELITGIHNSVALMLNTSCTKIPTDAWIRVAVAPGDLLVLPSGIYHRFTLDTKDQIRVLRLFKVRSYPRFRSAFRASPPPLRGPTQRGAGTDACTFVGAARRIPLLALHSMPPPPLPPIPYIALLRLTSFIPLHCAFAFCFVASLRSPCLPCRSLLRPTLDPAPPFAPLLLSNTT